MVVNPKIKRPVDDERVEKKEKTVGQSKVQHIREIVYRLTLNLETVLKINRKIGFPMVSHFLLNLLVYVWPII